MLDAYAKSIEQGVSQAVSHMPSLPTVGTQVLEAGAAVLGAGVLIGAKMRGGSKAAKIEKTDSNKTPEPTPASQNGETRRSARQL